MTLHFLYGEESILIEEQRDAIQDTLPNITPTYFRDSIDFLSLEQCIQTQDMFTPQKLILIRNPDFLTRSLTDKQLTRLQSLLETAKVSPYTIVIYMLEKSIDGRKKVVSWLKKIAICQEFKAFKDWEQNKILEWIKKTVHKHDKKIDQNALYALEQTVGLNLQELSSTIQTLLTYIGTKKNISQTDVETLCRRGTGSTFKLTEALKKNDSKTTLLNLSALIDGGEDPIRLLGLITSNIRLFIQILLADIDHQSPTNIAKSLGKNPYYLKRLIPIIKNHHTLENCKKTYLKLAETDTAIKTGQLKPELALQLLF